MVPSFCLRIVGVTVTAAGPRKTGAGVDRPGCAAAGAPPLAGGGAGAENGPRTASTQSPGASPRTTTPAAVTVAGTSAPSRKATIWSAVAPAGDAAVSVRSYPPGA